MVPLPERRRGVLLLSLAASLTASALVAVLPFPLKQHEASSEAISIAVSQVESDEVAELYPEVEGEEVSAVVGTAHGLHTAFPTQVAGEITAALS